MSAREPRFEIVRSHAGWFARFVASNGRKVWVDERTFPPLGDAL